jgi:hypothetical protein
MKIEIKKTRRPGYQHESVNYVLYVNGYETNHYIQAPFTYWYNRYTRDNIKEFMQVIRLIKKGLIKSNDWYMFDVCRHIVNDSNHTQLIDVLRDNNYTLTEVIETY